MLRVVPSLVLVPPLVKELTKSFNDKNLPLTGSRNKISSPTNGADYS